MQEETVIKNRTRVMITAGILLLVSLACSFPLFITPVDSEEAKSEVPPTMEPPPTETVSLPTVEPTNTPEPTAVNLQTAIAADWDGAWVIWFGDDMLKVDIDFLQDGTTITGNAVHKKGHSLAFLGEIATDGMSVSGTWEATDGTSGTFTIYDLGSFAQFNGNLDGRDPFCGARSAANQPAACFLSVTK